MNSTSKNAIPNLYEMPPLSHEKIKAQAKNGNWDNQEPVDQQGFFDSSFKVIDGKLFYLNKEKDVKIFISSELKVSALVRDKSSENWGRLLEFKDADGTNHVWSMPMELLKGGCDELRGELLRLGLEIAPSAKARNLLAEYITTAKPNERARCVNRTGWHDTCFVLPTQTFGSSKEKVIYQSDHQAKNYIQAGTLQEWQENISNLCAGNSRLVLAISCAFAAMLLKPTNSESGGINFVGESSTGKTTALKVAASVYGSPSYLQLWRATSNGLEGVAVLHSDTLLILDELAQIDPKEAGEVSYMLSNGFSKARASRTGAARKRQEWQLFFLSAGEIGLAQHMNDGGKKIKAGQAVRLVDIPADAGKELGMFENLHNHSSGAAFSKNLVDQAANYFGTPAIEFLKAVTQESNLADLPNTIKTLREQFIKEHFPTEASGQVYRVCERFALIACAGELATHYGITGWRAGEAQEAAVKCFNNWIEHRGGNSNQEKATTLSQIRRFFEMHGEARFTPWNATDNRTINRAGFKKVENDIARYYVLPETFRSDICSGLDYRAVTKILLSEKWIEPDTNGAAYRREYLPGMGRSRCYVITNKMWE